MDKQEEESDIDCKQKPKKILKAKYREVNQRKKGRILDWVHLLDVVV